MVKFCFREHDINTLGYVFLMILCIILISAVVPSKNYFNMQVCVAVTPYIFGCSIACLVSSV